MNKIFFHGVGDGIGEMMRGLDKKSIPFAVKSVDGGGLAYEAAKMANISGVPHVIVQRWTAPNGKHNDALNYHISPQLAGEIYYNDLRVEIDKTKELNPYRHLIYLEIFNEARTKNAHDETVWGNIHPCDWLGQCALYVAKKLRADGWKVAAFGMNAGEPEIDGWETAGMLDFLRWAATQDGKVTVSIHEGKTDGSNRLNVTLNGFIPHMVGRFNLIFAVCDKHNIKRPNIIISEWAWAYDDLPSHEQVIAEIEWLNEFYGRFPEVLSVHLWNLNNGSQWGKLPEKLKEYIPYIHAYSIEQENVKPSPPPEEKPAPPIQGRAFGIDVSKHQGYSLNWQQLAANDVTFAFMRSSIGTDIDWTYQRNHAEAGKYGVLRSAYHYLRPDNPEYQARIAYGLWEKGSELLPVVDIEHPRLTTEIAQRYITEFHRKSGVYPIIYTSPNIWANVLKGDKSWFKRCPLWIAHWGAERPIVPAPWGNGKQSEKGWLFWQFAAGEKNGRFKLDNNHFNGTVDQLFKRFGNGQKPPAPPIQGEKGNPLKGLKFGRLFKERYVLTSRFNEPRPYGNKKHEGVDYDVTTGEADSKAAILCPFDGRIVRAQKTRSDGKPSAYGWHYRIQSENNGTTFYYWIAHCDKLFFKVGDHVKRGEPIAELGGTGKAGKASFAEHVHINLEVSGYGLSGYVVRDVVDPEPFIPHDGNQGTPKPAAKKIDLLEYLRGDGRQYEVKHPSGATETFQTHIQGHAFYQVKNSQYEKFHFDNEFIYRSVDTSAGKAPPYAERPNKMRYYIQYDDGDSKAKWCKRFMTAGEQFTGSGHNVQFFYKDDCKKSAANSGRAVNRVKLKALHENVTLNGVLVGQTIELETNTGESMFFAKGFGLVGWKADWGESSIFEVHQGRDNLEREKIGCM